MDGPETEALLSLIPALKERNRPKEWRWKYRMNHRIENRTENGSIRVIRVWKRRGYRIAGVAVGCLFAAMMSIELTQHVPAEVEGYIYRKENKVSERETNGDQRGEGNNRTADFPETKVNPEIGAAPIERIENTAATSQIIFTDSVQPNPTGNSASPAEDLVFIDQLAEQSSNVPLNGNNNLEQILPEEIIAPLQDENQGNTWVEPPLPTPEPDQSDPVDLPADLLEEQLLQELLIDQPTEAVEPVYIEPVYIEPTYGEPQYIEPVYVERDEALTSLVF